MTNQLTEQQQDLLQYANLAKQMSMDVYNNNPSQYAGWECKYSTKDFPTNTGLFFNVYTNGDTAIVAIRGTEINDVQDLINDTQMLTNQVPKQYKDFAEQFKSNYRLQDLLANKRVITTGNSSGGSISEAAAVKFGWEAITLNSYGIKPWASQIVDSNGNPIFSDSNDYTNSVINFIADNDIIGNAGNHIGKNIYFDGPHAASLEGFINNPAPVPTSIPLTTILTECFQVAHLPSAFDGYDLSDPFQNDKFSTVSSPFAETCRKIGEAARNMLYKAGLAFKDAMLQNFQDNICFYIPEEVLRGSVNYTESFETVKDIFEGTLKPSDLIDYQIPEGSDFFVPTGGDVKDITYQYTQAPVVDAKALTIQAFIIIARATYGQIERFFQHPNLFPQAVQYLASLAMMPNFPTNAPFHGSPLLTSVFYTLNNMADRFLNHANPDFTINHTWNPNITEQIWHSGGTKLDTPTYQNPLSLDLDGDGIETLDINNSNVYFDMDNDGFKEKTGWLKGDDGLLAIDKNNNGKIDNQSELFGSVNTKGFEDLRVYDTNNDGIIDSKDAQFGDLKVWQDVNENGITDEGELYSLADKGISSINLNYKEINVEQNGNVIADESTFVKSDATVGKIYDALFAYDGMNTIYGGEYKLSADAINQPWLHGYGNVMDLQLAASKNSDLLALIENMSSMTSAADVFNSFDELLAKWAGVTASKDEMCGVISKQFAQVLEKFLGIEIAAVSEEQRVFHIAAYEQIKNKAFVEFIAQTSLANEFEINYDYKNSALVYNDNTYQKIVENLTDSESFIVSYTLSKELATSNSLDVNKLVGIITDLGYGASLISYINSGMQFTLDGELHYVEPQLPRYIIGTDGNDTIEGTNGADIIYGMDGNDLLIGGTGDDFLHGGSGDDILIGGEGNDTLIGGSGNDSMQGGSGNDTYIYQSGNDEVIDESWIIIKKQEWYQTGSYPFNKWEYKWVDYKELANGGEDTIIFDKKINPKDITISKLNNDLIFTNIYNQTLTVKNWYAGQEQRVEKFVFSQNGICFTDEQLINIVNTGTDNTVNGNDLSNLILVPENLSGEITVKPGKGQDLIIDNDTDTIYEINLNDGYKTITDYGGNDKIRFGEGIIADDIKYSRNGCDLLLTHKDGNTVVHLVDWFSDKSKRIEKFHYADGTLITSESLLQLLVSENPGESGDIIIAKGSEGVTLEGFAGNDYLEGTSGNDIINGGTGQDVMVGGNGDDVYYVDNTYDKVIEKPYEGTDTIYSSVTYTLGENVENLVLTGAQSINGYGNNLNNTITGNDGNNILYGAGGSNTLIGGKGNDTYIINSNLNNVIVEAADEGTDTIVASTSYTLGDNIENLILKEPDNTNTFFPFPSDNITGTGNNLDNYIEGAAGANNILIGGAGDDTLYGGYIVKTKASQPNTPSGDNDSENPGGNTGGGGDDDFASNPQEGFNSNPQGRISTRGSNPWDDFESNFDTDTDVDTDTDTDIDTDTDTDIDTDTDCDPPSDVNPDPENPFIKTYSDILRGGEGNDTYLFNKGCKDTVIEETSGNDTILLAQTSDKNNVICYKEGDNLVVNYNSDEFNSGNIIVKNHFSSDNNQIEKLQLSDGNYLTNFDINQLIQEINAYSAENGIYITSADDIRNNENLMQLVTSSWHS